MSCRQFTLFVCILLWFGAGCTGPVPSGLPAQLDPPVPEVSPDLRIEQGKAPGVPPGEVVSETQQTEALMFVGGHFVAAPYVMRIALSERRVYINHFVAHELPFASGGYQPELPPLPAGIDASTSWQKIDDLTGGCTGWSRDFCAYFFSVYPPSEAEEKFVSALQELPFYQRHEWAPKTGRKLVLRVYSKAGDKRDYFCGRWNPDIKSEFDFPYPSGPSDLCLLSQQGDLVKNSLNEFARYFKSNINAGEIIISGVETNGWIRIKRDNKRWYEIVNVVRILKSTLPNPEKIDTIYRRISNEEWPDDLAVRQQQPEWQAIAELVKNFQPHPQLDQRITELEKNLPIPLWSPPATLK